MVTRIQPEADSPALSAAARAFRTILTHVSADPQEAPRLRAAAALARKLDATLFGVACETIPPATAADPTGLPGHRVAAELNAAAGEIGADLIVAGGYGHSRLGEWVFGGVTYDLLHAQERFLLLSH